MKSSLYKKDGIFAWLAWTSAVIFYFYQGVVRVAPSVMEHELASAFSASATTLASSLGAFYFIYSPLQLFVGLLFDKFGGRKILIPASILVIVGCLLPILPSNHLSNLTFGRIATGMGASCAFIGVMYIAAVWFHDNKLALLSGMTTAVGFAGALMGQSPLSYLIDNAGWQSSFVWLAVAGAIITTSLTVFIPKTPHWENRQQPSTTSTEHNATFLSGLISVFTNKQTWIIGIVGGCLYMPTIVFGDLWGIQYIQCTLGLTKSHAAQLAGMMFVGWLIGSPLSGLLSDKIKCRRKLLIFSGFFSTILFLIMLLCPVENAYIIGLLLFLAGVTSSPQVICFVASLEANKPSAKGSAIAVVNMIVMIVGGIFQPIVGYLIDNGCSLHSGETITCETFKNALLTMPLVTFVGTILAFFIKRQKKEI